MSRSLVALAALGIVLSGCGITVGLRSDTGVLAAPPPGDATVEAGDAAEPAGGTTTPPTGEEPGEPDPTTTTIAGDSGLASTSSTSSTSETDGTGEPGSTSTTEPAISTSTEAPADTTTTTSDDPATSITTPDLPDIGTVFADDDAFVTHDCAGGDVTIAGDTGTYTLEGTCRAVLIRGSFNTVFVDDLAAVDITGTLNAVVYGAGNPTINDWDGDNVVTGG